MTMGHTGRIRPPRIGRGTIRHVSDDDETSEAPQLNQFVSWAIGQGVYRPVGKTTKTLPAGIYGMKNTPDGWYLEPTHFNSDELLNLPGLPTAFIMEQIETFWTSYPRFQQCGLLHKRGILLYGAAGCGKTSIIKMLANDLVARDGIVLLIDESSLSSDILQGIRQIEPDRSILTIIEDIDVFADDEYSLRALLSLLDGEAQINHVVHLATTNHPDTLDETIIKRPGRFDVVIELKSPVKEAREAYLRSLLGDHIPADQLEHLVDATAGLGLSHLRELVSATYCLQLNVEETLARLKGNVRLKLKQPSVSNEEGLGFAVGFGRGTKDD